MADPSTAPVDPQFVPPSPTPSTFDHIQPTDNSRTGLPEAVKSGGSRADALQAQFIADQAAGRLPVASDPTTPAVAPVGIAPVTPPSGQVPVSVPVVAEPTPSVPPQVTLPATPPAPAQYTWPQEWMAAPTATPPVTVPVNPLQPDQDALTEQEMQEFLAVPAAPGSDIARLQQQFRSFQGRMKAQASRDAAMIASLSTELRQRGPAQPIGAFGLPTGQPDPAALPPDLTDEEKDAFGPDLVALIERVAARKAAQASAHLVTQIAPVVNGIAQSSAVERETAMIAQLDAYLAPWQINFDALDKIPHFLAWLELTDAMSGVKRKDLLQSAWERQNTGRVWAICNAYLNEVAPRQSVQQPPLPAGSPPAPAPKPPVISLETLAAPGGAPRTGSPQQPVTPQGKPIYSRAQVAQFYDAKRRGFYRGREQEAQGYEAEIALAGQEGRIV